MLLTDELSSVNAKFLPPRSPVVKGKKNRQSGGDIQIKEIE